jgi:hypothetical protein
MSSWPRGAFESKSPPCVPTLSSVEVGREKESVGLTALAAAKLSGFPRYSASTMFAAGCSRRVDLSAGGVGLGGWAFGLIRKAAQEEVAHAQAAVQIIVRVHGKAGAPERAHSGCRSILSAVFPRLSPQGAPNLEAPTESHGTRARAQ